jgi:hypothetical protein
VIDSAAPRDRQSRTSTLEDGTVKSQTDCNITDIGPSHAGGAPPADERQLALELGIGR